MSIFSCSRSTLPIVLVFALIGCRPEGPDLILTNATIWTADDARPRAEAVAIDGGFIQQVGSRDEVEALAGPETEVLDLEGAFVVPGFIDTHVHFASAARFLEFNIMRVGTQEAFVERVRTVVERLPEEKVLLDISPRALDHALINLIQNAIKYSPPKTTVTIRLKATEDLVTIEVEDQGPGIAPESRSRIFERFFRVHGGRSPQEAGTGLGLSIARNMIERVGGHDARSRQGGGRCCTNGTPRCSATCGSRAAEPCGTPRSRSWSSYASLSGWVR